MHDFDKATTIKRYAVLSLCIVDWVPGVIVGEGSLERTHWFPVGPQHTALNVVEGVHPTTNDVAHYVEELCN